MPVKKIESKTVNVSKESTKKQKGKVIAKAKSKSKAKAKASAKSSVVVKISGASGSEPRHTTTFIGGGSGQLPPCTNPSCNNPSPSPFSINFAPVVSQGSATQVSEKYPGRARIIGEPTPTANYMNRTPYNPTIDVNMTRVPVTETLSEDSYRIISSKPPKSQISIATPGYVKQVSEKIKTPFPTREILRSPEFAQGTSTLPFQSIGEQFPSEIVYFGGVGYNNKIFPPDTGLLTSEQITNVNKKTITKKPSESKPSYVSGPYFIAPEEAVTEPPRGAKGKMIKVPVTAFPGYSVVNKPLPSQTIPTAVFAEDIPTQAFQISGERLPGEAVIAGEVGRTMFADTGRLTREQPRNIDKAYFTKVPIESKISVYTPEVIEEAVTEPPIGAKGVQFKKSERFVTKPKPTKEILPINFSGDTETEQIQPSGEQLPIEPVSEGGVGIGMISNTGTKKPPVSKISNINELPFGVEYEEDIFPTPSIQNVQGETFGLTRDEINHYAFLLGKTPQEAQSILRQRIYERKGARNLEPRIQREISLEILAKSQKKYEKANAGGKSK